MRPEAHRAVREQLGVYTLGQLAGEELRAMQDHVQTCPECQAELDALAPVAAALRAVDLVRMDETQPSERSLSPGVLREVRPSRSGSGRSRRVVLRAAAAVVTVTGGGIGYALGADGPAPPAGEPVGVRAMTPQILAKANLVAHEWGMEVKLTATGFVPGDTYRVTVTDRTGKTVNAGEFIGTGDAEMRCNLNSSVLRAAAALFQVRDPDGDVILTATL